MPDGDVFVLIGEGGRVVEWGRPAEELFGWSAEEAVGRSVTALLREVAADDEGRREEFSDTATVVVRPVLRGTAVLWQVLAAGETLSGRDVAILKAIFSRSPVGVHVLDERLRVVRTSRERRPDQSGPEEGRPEDGRPEDSRPDEYPPAKGLLGEHLTELYERLYGLEDPEEEAAVARGVLESGEPVVNRLVRGVGECDEGAVEGAVGPPVEGPDAGPDEGPDEGPGGPGRRSRTHSVSYFRLEDSRGDVLGLVACEADVTERENARNRREILDAARTQVGPRRSIREVCEDLAEAVVPDFAGLAAVEVVEDVVRGEEPPPVPVHRKVPLRRMAVRGPVPGRPGESGPRPGPGPPPESEPLAGPAYYPVGDVRPLPTGTPFSRVLSDLRPRLAQIGEDSAWLAADPVRAEVVRRTGAHSLVVAPLALHGRALGVVSFYRLPGEEPFDEEDAEVAATVCAHAVLCVDNAARYMREWMVALTVQRRLLPRPPTTQATVDLSHLHLPDPEGGGAWFDAIALPGARTALIVGEVMGRGITAASAVGLLRTAIHTLAALDLGPDELLARLNDTAVRLAAAPLTIPTAHTTAPGADPLTNPGTDSGADPVTNPPAGFLADPPGDSRTGSSTGSPGDSPEGPPADEPATAPLTAGCAVAIYDPVDLTCTLARAGLPEPVVVLPDGSSESLPVPAGPLLAGTDNAPFPATTVRLPEGSTLAIGTAALADDVLAPTGPEGPLLEAAATTALPEVCDDLASALTTGLRPRTGEALMLLARTKALPQDRVLTRDLPADPEAAPIARAAARRQLDAWGVDEETAFTTELVVSELVGNAIRYGAPPLRLRLIRERMLTCEVSDGAGSAPHVKHARTVDETGRGLFIIANLAEQWGTRFQDDGKTVWAQCPSRATAATTDARAPAASPGLPR
ncbi:SpoIIE family protein phosphatase [Streptomyces sp. SID3212]|uniref:ATP-binding SpoIIE family protein phosphatase n=1 Tax=Streptomyces sp. SID3212 TaxID=2690259 RepID=UPI001371BD73|nr:SpoIIE family protein phosphatase [Streptomyces sp. SID3212]MYV55636.1 SpoIIE family protein phosphatase [Streptomyces sp. SID3212]